MARKTDRSMNMTQESIMTPRGTPEEEKQLCMELFDPEGKGFITLLNLETILIANGFVDDKKPILDLFQTLDTGNRGQIPERDVIRLFEQEFVEVESNVKQIFQHFDGDGKGKIDCDKLRAGAEELGVQLTDKQANAMIQPFDSNRDGAVDLKDLEAVLA